MPRYRIRRQIRRAAVLTSLVGPVVGLSALAQDRPTLNTYGATGLITMPSAEMQPDGMLTATRSQFGNTAHNTLSFQITPRVSGSFRYSGVKDLAIGGYGVGETYYDRSFDLRFKVFEESRYIPDITVGLQDFVGTGIYSAEFIAATKHLTPSLKVTGGLGWGRLGSYGALGSPLGDRPAREVGQGGKPNYNEWFRGPAAPFAGIEWQVTDKFGLKAEYSSDDFTLEQRQGVFDRKSPLSFGAEYQVNEAIRLGAYYMNGSELGLTAQIFLNPKKRAVGGYYGPAPLPVKLRPSRAADPDAWSGDWVTQPGAPAILRDNIAKRLEDDGIVVEALAVSATRAELRVRNRMQDSEAQVIGRAARAMARALPASVEVFEIVPVVNGVPASKVILRRSDLERLEHAPGNADALWARTAFADTPMRLPEGAVRAKGLYPGYDWSVGPYLRTSYFDPDAPLRAEVGLRFSGKMHLAPGLLLSGSVTKALAGNLDDPSRRTSNSVLPHVRTDAYRYDAEGDPSLEQLTLAWYSKPAGDIYGRVTAGYLERMYGGVSAEVLWKRADSPLALGAELNYARKRDFDQGFGFQDYDVVTGHVSAYYDFGNGFLGQVDVGRYLAGDVGATIALDREFGNGWKVGAFATFTDVSAEEFGEGSFDKGIRLTIPLAWLTGKPTRTEYSTTLRPVQRDGGARLSVSGRLYETISDYDANSLDSQWGRVWR